MADTEARPTDPFMIFGCIPSSNRTEPTGGKVVRYKLDAAGFILKVSAFPDCRREGKA